jgi:hypothetical protein
LPEVDVQLALRKTDGKTLLPRLFNLATRWRLHTKYPHAGIVIDGTLYHTTLTEGLHAVPFDPEGWDVFEFGRSDAYARAAFNARLGAEYDAISLLAFLLPWRVRDSRRLYCYEWCWLAMTAENPGVRITPEMLLVLVNKKAVMNGNSGS